MNPNVDCITCKNNLLDTAKVIPEHPQFAVCTKCSACYQIVPALNPDGTQRYGNDGEAQLYLNPVKAGVWAEPEKKPDFSKLLDQIQKAHTPTDLID